MESYRKIYLIFHIPSITEIITANAIPVIALHNNHLLFLHHIDSTDAKIVKKKITDETIKITNSKIYIPSLNNLLMYRQVPNPY